MRRAITHAMIWLVMAACFICPVMQMFDHWDHELKSGQDTETTFIIIALCVGATIAVARAIVIVSNVWRASALQAADRFQICFESGIQIDLAPFAAESPPLAILRI